MNVTKLSMLASAALLTLAVAGTAQAHSWNSSHNSRDCSQDGLIATGGNGLLYCFAQ